MFHSNLGGITPTTVRGSPSSMSVRPITPGSAAKSLTQVRWAITPTGGAPGAASASPNTRPSRGWHAEKREAVRRHPRDRQALRAGVADPVHALDGWCRRRPRRPVSAPDNPGTRCREIGAADDAIGRILQDDIHHAIRAGVRKRIEHDVAKHAVDDRDRPDAKRQRDDRDGGEAGRSRERADAVADVAPKIFQHGGSKPPVQRVVN